MGNKMGMLPANGHRIQGRSSEDFLNVNEIFEELDFKDNEIFMDAGCGDGHAAIEAVEVLGNDALIYAVDVYEPSITDLEKYVEKESIPNLIPLCCDMAEHIDVEDDSIDTCLMINVFHGFKARRNMDDAIIELKRIIKPKTGKIAIMDYKKQEAKHGPPFAVRSSPEELEEMFNKHGLKKISLNNEIGEDIEQGKSHFLITFGK